MAVRTPGYMRSRLGKFLSAQWIVGFSPFFYSLSFAATLRIVLVNAPEIPFEVLGGGEWIFRAWCVLNLLCPILVLGSWMAIRYRPGRLRYVGLCTRLGADIGQFLALLAFHAAGAIAATCGGDVVNESTIYRRYITAGILLWFLLLIARDLWYVVTVERVANRLRKR